MKFNSVLMNWYRDGEDYLNWHADDEKELGVNPIVGSVNFGATRDFVVGLHQFQTTNAVCQSVQIYSDQQVHQILKCSSPVFSHQLVFQGLGTLAHEIDLFACLLTLTCS